jgi:ribosomal protein S18 acetylase RimI-like enzyme
MRTKSYEEIKIERKMQESKNWFKSKGISQAYLNVKLENKKAINLYKRLGYVSWLIDMRNII